MATTTAMIYVGSSHRFHSGIKSRFMVSLQENDSPYLNPWIMEFEEQESFSWDRGNLDDLEVGPIPTGFRERLEESGLVLEGETFAWKERDIWQIRDQKGRIYVLRESDDAEGLKIRKVHDVAWKKQDGYDDHYVPHLADWFGKDSRFSNPITDMLLTFCIERSKASGRLSKMIGKEVGGDHEGWINNICMGADTLKHEDYLYWRDWRYYVWTESFGEDEGKKSTLRKARKIIKKHEFEGIIVGVLLEGISHEAHKGIVRDLNGLNTEVVLFDENENKNSSGKYTSVSLSG